MDQAPDRRDSFLPLGAAAERLGVSRLKLREAIVRGLVPARRDNEGRLRVDLADMPADLVARLADSSMLAPADPAALMGALFDEIDELSGDLDDSRVMTDRLARIAGAQSDALETAMSTLERAEADRDRLAALAERALAGAEEAGQRAAALQSMTDRALALLDRSTAATAAMQEELGRIATDKTNKDAVIATHAAQIDRLFTLSERALEKAAETRRAPSLIARVLGVGRSKT